MSGLTMEEVNEMQDAMFKIDGIDGVDTGTGDSATKDNTDEEAAKLAEAKAAEDKVIANAAALKAKEEEDGKAKDNEDVDLIRELREQVRASNEALKKITGDYQKLQKVLVDKGVITEEEEKLSKAEEDAQKATYEQRQEKLTEMVTIMELNPAYTDVREVCSQGNLDDVIDAFSRFYVKQNGGDRQEVAMQMEAEIWAEANPFKKIYEIVKQYHPRYTKKDDKSAETEAAEAAAKKLAEEADKKKAIEANPTGANMGAGGSGAGASGWTAAKIDALDEFELKTVPKEIYEKYLLGTLN
jgi:hypothetical protein